MVDLANTHARTKAQAQANRDQAVRLIAEADALDIEAAKIEGRHSELGEIAGFVTPLETPPEPIDFAETAEPDENAAAN